MTLISPGDELVSGVSLYKSRHPLLHGYTSPFFVLYIVWIYNWLFVYGYQVRIKINNTVSIFSVSVRLEGREKPVFGTHRND